MYAPNGEIPMVDPFALGLEAFGITKGDTVQPADFAEGQAHPTESKRETCPRIREPESGAPVQPLLLDEAVRQAIEAAIRSTLPTGPGQRNGGVFELCRALKGIPEVRNLTARELRPVVEWWYRLALSVITTKSFDQTRADFEHGWERVKWPRGAELLLIAREMALRDLESPPEANRYEDPRTQLLVRVCYQLQLLHGDQSFFLSWHAAGQLIGLSHPEAGKRLEMLVRDGTLKVTETNTSYRARRYRFAGGQIDTERDRSRPEADVPAAEDTPNLDAQAEVAVAIEDERNFTADGERAQPQWD